MVSAIPSSTVTARGAKANARLARSHPSNTPRVLSNSSSAMNRGPTAKSRPKTILATSRTPRVESKRIEAEEVSSSAPNPAPPSIGEADGGLWEA